MTRRYQPREDVAELLRQGHPYQVIKQQLRVSGGVIAATRRAYGIPLPEGRPGYRYSPKRRAVIEQKVIEMLLAGASYREIRGEVGVSFPTILRIREEAGIPASGRRPGPPVRSVGEVIALYSEPYGDGHTRWTGPMSGRMPQLYAERRRFNARHAVFERHYGRPPVGYVSSSCGETPCMTGAHLTDAVMRSAARKRPAAVPNEDHSTGTAWRTPRPPQPCTPKEQAQHWAELTQAVKDWRVGDAGRRQSYRRRR